MSAAPERKQVLRSSENVARNPTTSKPPSTSSVQATPKQAPPKPPRSAFICFTDAKKRDIMNQHGITEENDEILKIVAREWKSLSDKDRAHWDEEARNDKVRFVREKAAYKGSWSIPKRRAKKHPLAPRRPMSAFLKFSQTRRAIVKTDNPDMSNTDVSRLLGEMWRNASPKERLPYVEAEERERKVYKEEIKKWRDDQARMDAASRSSHQSVQQQCSQRHHLQPANRLRVPPAPPSGQDRSFATEAAASFENLQTDALDDHDTNIRNKAYRVQVSQYSNPYPLYRHTQYPPHQDLSILQSDDYQESDPIPVTRLSLANTHLHQSSREDEAAYESHCVNITRSRYFPDNSDMDYYSRYH